MPNFKPLDLYAKVDTWPGVYSYIKFFDVDRTKTNVVEPKKDLTVVGWDNSHLTAGSYMYRHAENNHYFFVYPEGSLHTAHKVIVLQDERNHALSQDILDAMDYWDEVRHLHVTSAGKKAVALLKEFLNEAQRESIDKDNRFAYNVAHFDEKGEVQTPLYQFRFQLFPYFEVRTRLYIPRAKKKKVNWVSFCWHPEEPIPPADLALIYLLEIENNGPQSVLKQANW